MLDVCQLAKKNILEKFIGMSQMSRGRRLLSRVFACCFGFGLIDFGIYFEEKADEGQIFNHFVAK
jgi:hypothetical protein